jgi:hypothetical protein
MGRLRRITAACVLHFMVFLVGSVQAHADDEVAVEAAAPVEPPRPAPPFTFVVDFGPTFGWYAGGHIGLGFTFRLTDWASFVVSPRVAGGQGWDDNPFVVLGGDLGVRFRRVADASGVAHVALGTAYMVEIEGPRTSYLYVAPHLRLGGGIRLRGMRWRSGWGVEGTMRLGYAFDVTDHSVEMSNVDYGGVYGAFEVSIVFEF